MEWMQKRVREWREKVGLDVATVPENPADYFGHTAAWRCFREECRELDDADETADIAKEMADVLVTLFGLACSYGIDMEPVFAAVMDSNDTKTGDKDAGGKVIKGESYVPPDIAGVLRAQGWDG